MNRPDEVRPVLQCSNLRWGHIDAVASRLAVSGSTLRRRLDAHGTSFGELLKQERIRRVKLALADNPNLRGKAIAADLGYLELHSFYRAFSAWFGVTFSEYKKANLAAARTAGADT
jgi:AraC-like DNA-binding protein